MNITEAIISFDNAEFGNLRTVESDGVIEFCGKDIANALGYANPSKALKDHCKGGNKTLPPLQHQAEYRMCASSASPTSTV